MKQRVAPTSILAVAATLAAASLSARAADAGIKVALAADNIKITAGAAGNFELSYPSLFDKSGQVIKRAKPPELNGDSSQADISYEGGATATVKLNEQTLDIEFANLPDNAKSYKVTMLIPMGFNNGGTYQVGDAKAAAFPKDKPAKPHLVQKNAAKLTLSHPSGVVFTIKAPAAWSYQEITDNREWNWSTFAWNCSTEFGKGQTTAKASISLSAPDKAQAKVLIDEFGQIASAKFPTKVASEDELKADVAKDEAYYAALNPPATDSYGGLPGSGEKLGLKKTGFFHVEAVNGKQVMVSPEGNAFFQLGICGMTPLDDYTTVKGREGIYAWLPERRGEYETAWRQDGVMSFYIANQIRKFGKPFDLSEYAGRQIDRMRKWGFNSGGAWSFDRKVPAVREKSFPTCDFLPLPGLAKVGTRDVWDSFGDNVEDKIDAAFAKNLPPKADEPLIIGYFSANEPPLDDVPRIVPTLDSKSGSKRKLVEMLKATYPSIDAFNTAWKLQAASFDALADMPLPVNTAEANKDVQAFFQAFMDRRYQLLADTFHKYDKNHLLLGDRWTPGVANNQAVVTAGGKYFDVLGVNYYSYSIDKAFLGRIHQWGNNKPLLLSEFHFSCTDQGMPTGHGSVNSQTERGQAYRNYLEQAAATGYVVGIQWFEGLDEATTGRFFEGFNGESSNTGLLNVCDRPYTDFLSEVTKGNYEVYDVALNGKTPYLAADPRLAGTGKARSQTVAVPHLKSAYVADSNYSEFPGVPPTRIGSEGLVMGANSDGFEASYRIAWDNDALYLYCIITDPTPMMSRVSDADIWNADAVEVFIGGEDIDQPGALKFTDRQILLRGAAPAAGKSAAFIAGHEEDAKQITTLVTPNSDGHGYTLKARLPFAVLGFTPKVGQKVLFDLAIDDSKSGAGRARQLVWNGNDRNSKDRSAWGKAEFVP